MTVRAEYVSEFDYGNVYESYCDFDTETNDASNIEQIDVDGDGDIGSLVDEFIRLADGTELREFTIEGEESYL